MPLSAAALKYGGQHIEAGMTTWELDKLIYDFIVKHGGTPELPRDCTVSRERPASA